MDEQTINAVGFFNFAHSYCASAIALGDTNIDATHPDSVVYYLYYHAIELYLKSYLLAQGVSLEDIEKKYRHHTRKIANKAKTFGLKLTEVDEQVITQMAKSDNVISARYLRIGHHRLLPMVAYHEVCHRLHHQICETAYEAIGGTRRPILEAPKANSLVGYRFAEPEE